MKKTNMEEYAYNELKRAIFNRNVLPGKQLVENTISQKLKISRSPIRAALKKLEDQNLVTIISNKGAFVIHPTREEIKQAYQMREELEIIGVKLAINKITKNDICKLKQLCEEEKITFQNKDIETYIAVNKKIHMTIIEKSGNKYLIEYASKIIDQTNIYLVFYDVFLKVTFNTAFGAKEHFEIIDLLEEKDIELLKQKLHQHIMRTHEDLEVKETNFDINEW